MIPLFKKYLEPTDRVFEIGKSEVYSYKDRIPNLITLDRDIHKNPDILIDIETVIIGQDLLVCDAMMCIGVTEECSNPFNLIEGLARIIKDKGIVLFGIALIGNKGYDNDYWRFTISGARKLVNRYFDTLQEKIIYTNGIPSYSFIIANKI
jgi:hypothetical protein